MKKIKGLFIVKREGKTNDINRTETRRKNMVEKEFPH